MSDPEQLEATVRALATPAGRKVGTAGHDAARQFLLAAMEEAGLSGYGEAGHEHPYRRRGIDFCNLIGVLPGTNLEQNPIVIAAHYDTCGDQPGADDNAAAIAISLSIVEPLRSARLERSVIFAFFDAEEPPHYLSETMGSIRWYEDQRREETHCAIVLDLVGHDVALPGLEDAVFVTGVESDPALEPIFRGAAGRASVCPLPTLTRYIGDMSDYHCFRIDRRPYLFLSCAQWEHYHAVTDTPEKLNYHKMAGIAELLTDLTREVAATELNGPFEGSDTTAMEVAHFNAAARPLLDQFGFTLETREDMDRLAELLTGHFLSSG